MRRWLLAVVAAALLSGGVMLPRAQPVEANHLALCVISFPGGGSVPIIVPSGTTGTVSSLVNLFGGNAACVVLP
jgi:hypothetical protein